MGYFNPIFLFTKELSHGKLTVIIHKFIILKSHPICQQHSACILIKDESDAVDKEINDVECSKIMTITFIDIVGPKN